MLLKPHAVIKGVNSDVILMRYPGYFKNIEVVLKEVAKGGRLGELVEERYQGLFEYVSDAKVSLLEWIIYHSDLYDSQLLLMLKGQCNIDHLLKD